MATSDETTAQFSEETFDYKCTAVCRRRKRDREAVRGCPYCKKYFCSSCLEAHDDMHDDHKTVEPSVLFGLQPATLLTEECKKHGGKMIDVWCVQHNALGCVSCAFFEHRSCDGVKDITTEIKEIFKQEEFDAVRTDLTTSLEYLTNRQRFINGEKENLLVEKNEQLSKIDEISQRLIKMIKDLVKKAKDELASRFKELEDEMQKVADDCKVYEENIRQCMTQFESCIGNEPQMFITMKNAQQTIALADRNCRDPVLGDCTVVFKPDSSVEQYLASLNSLGTSSKLPRKYEVKHKQKINVNLSDDSEECDIMGSCLLPDGSLIVADDYNRKLKHVDITSTYTAIDSCTVPGNPRGVCCVGQKEVAVTLWSNKIQFVTLGRTMTLSRKIDLKFACYVIAYHNEELFVSDGRDTIHVTNMHGSLLRKFTTIASSRCYQMVVSSDGGKVFSACWDGGLLCTDRQGSPIYTHTYKNIDKCHGICHDNGSSLFVCGYSSGNVVQVSSESGEDVGEIVNRSDGVYSPKSLCFDASRQRLIVTDISDKILLIDLEPSH